MKLKIFGLIGFIALSQIAGAKDQTPGSLVELTRSNGLWQHYRRIAVMANGKIDLYRKDGSNTEFFASTVGFYDAATVNYINNAISRAALAPDSVKLVTLGNLNKPCPGLATGWTLSAASLNADFTVAYFKGCNSRINRSLADPSSYPTALGKYFIQLEGNIEAYIGQ